MHSLSDPFRKGNFENLPLGFVRYNHAKAGVGVAGVINQFADDPLGIRPSRFVVGEHCAFIVPMLSSVAEANDEEIALHALLSHDVRGSAEATCGLVGDQGAVAGASARINRGARSHCKLV